MTLPLTLTLTLPLASAQMGMTALMIEAASGQLDCLEHFIAKRANPNAQSCEVRRGPSAAARGWGLGRGRRLTLTLTLT